MSMQLADLLARLATERIEAAVHGPSAVDIASVDYDSRQVRPGSLFCCLPGLEHDGHDFAGQAVAAGAVALLCERRLELPVTEVVVPDTRAAMGPLAACHVGDPSHELSVVGITGTNGKTTTTALLRAVAEHAGVTGAAIGTLTGSRTTPEAPELQRRLSELRTGGVELVAMEVSSHALALHRVDGTRFRVAVFTNLSQDHLDFHRSMEEYFLAKARLFSSRFAEAAVVNADDVHGRRLLETLDIPAVAYGWDLVEDPRYGVGSSRFRWRGHHVDLPLGGSFNVLNAVAAAETARVLGIDDAAIAAGLATVPAVPGRFEVVDEGPPFSVIVDYAHTADGLRQVLSAARSAVAGRVLVVFGCGGDRDREKRPLMGRAAEEGADRVFVTSDNPRGENPGRIIEDVLAGLERRDDVEVQPDRRRAIAIALETADAGDVVLIAGKGHERTQTIGDEVRPFDDREVAREELRRLREAAT